MPPFPEVLWRWTFEPAPLLVALAAAAAYGRGVGALRRRGRRWPARRTVAFGAGLVALAVATQSPIARYDVERFSMHAAQHVLLAMVVPPLVALGAPATLALQAAARHNQRRILRVVHSPPVAFVTSPLVAWLLFAATPFALYFTPLFDVTLRNGLVHEAVHVHLVASGLVFFWPVVGIDPARRRLPYAARLGYLFVTIPVHAFLGVAIVSATRRLGGGSWPLPDQARGGALMLVSGDLLAFVALAVVAARWMAAEERASEREDRRVAREATG